jgi:hypothetical protein
MKVPCAVDGTAVVFPPDACRKRKYDCIECGGDVVLHDGPIRIAHFAHVGNRGGCGGGGGESFMHRSTKEWIASIAISDVFVVWTRCTVCHAEFDVVRGSAELQPVVECTVTPYSVDVALFSGAGRIAGFVEVYHTHETSVEKRTALEATAGWPCPVVEIKAVDLVAQEYPKRFECISPRRCTSCLASAIEQRRVQMFERYAAFFRRALRQFRARRLVESILVEDLIGAIVAATERVARRWLLKIRVRRLTVILNRDLFVACSVCKTRTDRGVAACLLHQKMCQAEANGIVLAFAFGGVRDRWYCSIACLDKELPYCLDCWQSTSVRTWCPCKRKRMAKCAVCDEWAEKASMNAALPMPRGKFTLWMHPSCCKQCSQCDRPFRSDEGYEHVRICLRCNYERKHGRDYSPNDDGSPDGLCSQCDKYIRSIRYGGWCWKCSH